MSHCGISVAHKTLTRIRKAIENLARFPDIGRHGRLDGTRELVVPRTQYFAVYERRGRQVVILRVLHMAQEWPPSASETEEQ
jgi:toxin ParE1/3/4